MRYLTIVLVGLIFGASPALAVDSWSLLRDPAGVFTVEFPTSPSVKNPDDSTKPVEYVFDAETMAMVVQVDDFTGRHSDASRVLEAAARGVIGTGTLKSDIVEELDGQKGRYVTFMDKDGYQVTDRIFFVNEHLYQILTTLGSTPTTKEVSNRRRFNQSFHFITAPTTQQAATEPPKPIVAPPVAAAPPTASPGAAPLAAGAASGAASTDKRVALVIGNSAYRTVNPLRNPENDAHAIAEEFRKLGFAEVIEKHDLSLADLSSELKAFGDKAQDADWAVVYYAGHGIEVGGVNYVIPVDAELKTAAHVEEEAIPLDRVLSKVEGAHKLRLVILDACRDNPFAQRLASAGGTRSVGRGLARVEPAGGVMVAYSARDGHLAQDGDAANSPFAQALVQNLEEPGVEISLVFRKVHDAVLNATHGEQEPFTYGALPAEALYFAGLPAVADTPKSASTGGRLELALVAEDPAKASGPPLHDYGDANTTYGIERDITLPGDIESFAATTIDIDATTRTPAINIVLAAPAVDRINRGANLVDRRIALVLDGRTVLSVAVLRVPFLPSNLQLTGNFSLNDVSRLVDAISDNPRGIH